MIVKNSAYLILFLIISIHRTTNGCAFCFWILRNIDWTISVGFFYFSIDQWWRLKLYHNEIKLKVVVAWYHSTIGMNDETETWTRLIKNHESDNSLKFSHAMTKLESPYWSKQKKTISKNSDKWCIIALFYALIPVTLPATVARDRLDQRNKSMIVALPFSKKSYNFILYNYTQTWIIRSQIVIFKSHLLTFKF